MNFIESILESNNENKKTFEKEITLNLDLAYPELPTKYYAQWPLPRPNHVGCASLLAWLLYSNKFYLDNRWFQDHRNFWANNALMKLSPLTRFFHLMAFLRPAIQRSWIKVIWIIFKFFFAILTIVGVVGLAAFNSTDTWTNHLIIGLLGTGLAFVCLNILCWILSFILEKYMNMKWRPTSKNKRLFACLEQLVSDAKEHFGCTSLKIRIDVLVLDNDSLVGKKVSKKTLKQDKNLKKEMEGWRRTLSILIDGIEERVPDLEIIAVTVKKPLNNYE